MSAPFLIEPSLLCLGWAVTQEQSQAEAGLMAGHTTSPPWHAHGPAGPSARPSSGGSPAVLQSATTTCRGRKGLLHSELPYEEFISPVIIVISFSFIAAWKLHRSMTVYRRAN